MHHDAFDQIIRDGARRLPRRGVLGLAAGLTTLALGGSSVGGRRKKRKKCKNGTSKCGKNCLNLKTDSANCGACGVVCTGSRICNNGVCACPANQSLIAGTCIPRFGCTLDLDTCTVGKKRCPESSNDDDARCHVSADGEPFCATAEECVSVPDSSGCPTIGGQARILIPCTACDNPGETGQCVLPIVRSRTL